MSSAPYPNAQAIFYQQYETVRRDEVVGILLALFLGTFGVHHFYLHRTGLGILYCCFCWTGIPTLLGFIECFFMPRRVREYNAIQAAAIAASLGIAVPGWGQPVNIPTGTSPVAAPVASFAQASGFVSAAGFVPAVVPAPLAAPAQAPCPNCQRVNPPGAKFCVGCGQAL